MNRTVKIILLVAGVLYLAGCHQDNRVRKDPRYLLKDVPIDPNVWNDVAITIYQRMKLEQEQKAIDQRYMLSIENITQDPNLPMPVKR